MSTLIQTWKAALANTKAVAGAHEAVALFRSYCVEGLPRVPGMATADRLAIRIHSGHTAEEAAAKEYLYRWNLAIKAPDQCMLPNNSTLDPCVSVFGTPHTIGM